MRNTPFAGCSLRLWRSPVCVNARILIIILLSVSLFYTAQLGQDEYVEESDALKVKDDEVMEQTASHTEATSSLPCVIDGNTTIECVRKGTEVYLPFSFIRKDFEVYGKFSKQSPDETVFEFEHSIGVAHAPIETYHAMGTHIDDLYAFVEGRPWVIFVDGRQGVPLCRQWFPDGFFFSTNIAQFGLAHYSQHVVQEPPFKETVDDGGSSEAKWTIPSKDFSVSKTQTNAYSETRSALAFHTTDMKNKEGIFMKFNEDEQTTIKKHQLYHFTMHYKFSAESSIIFHIHRKTDDKVYQIHYVCNDTSLYASHGHVIIGIGKSDGWRRLTRNLYLDLEQGIFKEIKAHMPRVDKLPRSIGNIVKVELRGSGELLNLTLCSSAHLDFVNDAAEWVMRNQDDKGGWAMPVKRPLGTDVLQPGWYTALGQGVCISLLARAYGLTKDERYLNAAIKALKLFHVLSKDGGVRAVFMDKYVWYEEYPTQPPSFVLNGFIISLLGLYDLATTAPSPHNADARELFDTGMNSLKALLPFYDIGSRTVYDLRHLTMLTTPNICRWDYHNLHTLLMQNLATIDDDPIFKEFGDRWFKYKTGYRSPHN